VSVKPRLNPTAVEVAITIGQNSTTLGPVALLGYGGDPLYLHAQSDGTTLSILVDGNSTGSIDGTKQHLLPASSVNVAFNGGETPQTWQPFAANFKAGLLSFSAKLDEGLTTLTLMIADVTPSSSGSKTYGFVRFVLFQDSNGDYHFNWIDDILIAGISGLTSGDVVDVAPDTGTAGSIAGPMGFMLS
jgi:hypothetical protein